MLVRTPESWHGLHENIPAALGLASHSASLVAMLILLWLCFFVGNYLNFVIMKHLSAVHLALVSACEAIAVWSLNVLLFYALGGRCKSRYGEDWKGLWSWIQLLGFTCVACGVFAYYGAAPAGSQEGGAVKVKGRPQRSTLGTQPGNGGGRKEPLLADPDSV